MGQFSALAPRHIVFSRLVQNLFKMLRKPVSAPVRALQFCAIGGLTKISVWISPGLCAPGCKGHTMTLTIIGFLFFSF